MGNAHIKPHPRQRNKKQVHWRAAARPNAPGKPSLVTDGEPTPDLVPIRWLKPTSDGGSPISGYLVEHRRAGSPHWVRATPFLVQTNELTVSGLEPGWRYQFRVSAENAVGISDPSELSEIITVTLQRSAVTAPRITQDLQDTEALENEKAEFVVHFLGQPPPKVCWYKDAFEIFSSRRIRIFTETDRSVLTIHQSSLSDEGEIKCTATNRAGHVTTKAKLVVQAPPSVRLPRQYEEGLLFEIGELIRLKVTVAGRPTPLVFWTHNGESIKNNERYEIEYSDNSSILKITNAKREDRGEYLVKAVNKLGEHTQSFLVTVTDKPSPPGKAKVVMALGRSVTLSWSVPSDDGGCKIGNYIVEYYRLGWDVWLKAATSRQVSTMLGDLIEGSEYKFRIKAESPYGVSEPSEESEVVFIPDKKRGILEPSVRSRSQPREVEEITLTPVARRKNKQRSSSSSRVENIMQSIQEDEPPKRPVRTKIKSPSKTPEASPLPMKKDLNYLNSKRELETKLNKEMFERSDSLARDLAYGSPGIKIKKELSPENYSSSNMSRTPSPTDQAVFKIKIQPPEETKINRSPSPSRKELKKPKLPRDNSENFTGQTRFDLDDDLMPPPMSLSAPELGNESPIFNPIKLSCSSTELLHERAMTRLYEAAKAEEKEIERRRMSKELKGLNIEIPKIQINSKDQQEKVDLERMRRLSGGTAQQLWTRRHSLKNPKEFTLEDERSAMKTRQRSESEELEEEILENVRTKMVNNNKEKRRINIADVEKWADDYASSTEESSIEEDDYTGKEIKKVPYLTDEEEEEETYHPRELRSMSLTKEEPFEILTKRKDLPNPNFIPKPILKKKELEEEKSNKIKRPLSPIPPNITKFSETSTNLSLLHKTIPEEIINSRSRSSSLTPNDEIPMERPKSPRKRAFSLLPQIELLQKSKEEDKSIISRKRSFSLIPPEETPAGVVPESIYNLQPTKTSFLMQTIAAAATISGITAASIVIPDRLMEKQKDAEESKVVVDHYSDIVKNYGNRGKSSTSLSKSRESLQKSKDSLQAVEEILPPKEKISNYHDSSYPTELKSKNSAFSSTSSAESGYISSNTSKAPTPNLEYSPYFNNEKTSSESPKEPSLTQESKSSTIIEKKQALGKQEIYEEEPNRPLSPPMYQQYSPDMASKQTRRLEDVSPNRSISPSNTQSYSPERTFSPSRRTKRSSNASPGRHSGRKKSASPYPRTRIISPSPIGRIETSHSPIRSTPSRIRPPKLKEIMTQTSEGLSSMDENYPDFLRQQRREKLTAQAEIKVHHFFDYVTDLAMFSVACWFYLFSNELYAIPVLLVLVYRQLQVQCRRLQVKYKQMEDIVYKRIPKWLIRLTRRTKKE